MRIIVTGGDGFCGWPTVLELCIAGHEILILDNLWRRRLEIDRNLKPLIPIPSIEERLTAVRNLGYKLDFEEIDVAKDYEALTHNIRSFKPDCVVHFAEQRSAPYSMLSTNERRFTVQNNVNGTQNLLEAILQIAPNIKFVHLGTMGVYGYNDSFGPIPEGYLDVIVEQTSNKIEIPYPPNPGSIYHMTKVLDNQMFQFYTKNWGLDITDLHQGIVWGFQTEITKKMEALRNRIDYDGEFGTVLNRFLVQAANRKPLTIYGSGGQTRAFIHIEDTAKCVRLACEDSKPTRGKVKIFNQVSEWHTIKDLATIVSNILPTEIEFLPNPRNELADNKLSVMNKNFKNLGWSPLTLTEDLLEDIIGYIDHPEAFMDMNKIRSKASWNTK